MSENAVQLPDPIAIDIDDAGADGPLHLLIANNDQNGLEVKAADVRALAPDAFAPRTVANRVVTDTDSFAAEIERRPLVAGVSTVWGDRPAGNVTVVYDELDPSAVRDFTRRGDRLVLQFVADPDWATMRKAADGQFHGQEEFGDLIEAVGHLITSHPAAELMEIVDSVRASKSGSFESRIRRDTGSQHLVYTEEVTAKAGSSSREMEVPREITLSARPFEDYPLIEVTCWLRLRVNQGQLHLGLFPQPYEHLVRGAWAHVTGDLTDRIGVPVYAANLTGRR